MAKFTAIVPGTIDRFWKFLDRNTASLGTTATLEDVVTGSADGIKYKVCTYERYAVMGENRVSLNVVMLEYSEGVRIVATASGGSTGAFLKINHWSEDNFLSVFEDLVKAYNMKAKR